MHGKRDRMLTLIGVFKLVKAVALVALGVGLLEAIHHGAAEHLRRIVPALDAHRARVLGVAVLPYAALFTVEGIGLLSGRRWAEWFTVIATASLVPLEIYEIARAPHPMRIGALIANLAIVAYLIVRLRHDRREAATT